MLNEQEIIALLEGTLTPDERERLEKLLETDSEARHQMRAQSQLDSVLRVTLGGAASHERVKQSILAVVHGESEEAIKQHVLEDTSFTPRGSRREGAQTKASQGLLTSAATNLLELLRRPAWAFSFAAVCLCLGLGAWLVLRSNPTRPTSLASSIETPSRVEFPAGTEMHPRPGVEIQYDRSAGSFVPQSGDGLRVGETGSGTVRFTDGTVLHLEPGTEVRFQPVAQPQRDGGKQLKLLTGSLSADVAKQPAGVPLLIETPHALITVVGTEFDLMVLTNRTELEVTHGLVKVSGANAPQAANVAAGEFAVASAKTALRYGALPRNPYLWPFSSTSPWNTPIGSGAKFAPVPGKPFLADGQLAKAVRGRRPIMGRPADPLRNVWVNGELRGDVRLGDSTLPPVGRDPVVFLQHARRYATELRDATVRSDGNLEATDSERTDLAGPGASPGAVPAMPFGLSNLGGLIRAGEYDTGIRHALSARISRQRLGGNDFHQPTTVWPAAGNPASDTRSEPERLNVGTLLAIPPEVDIKKIVGESGPGYELARAMQDYGVYITGYLDAPFVLLTGEARLDAQTGDALLNQLVPLLQVVVNNTLQTPGGGGAPRQEPAPALPGEY